MARGVPNNPIECSVCHELKAGSSGLCRDCRLPKMRRGRTLTVEEQQILRDAYASGTTKAKLSAALTDACRRLNMSKVNAMYHARKLGLCVRRYWTPEEIATVEQCMGRLSATAIAKKLHRSVAATIALMGRRGLSRRLDGYRPQHVAELFGVRGVTVNKWIESGALHATSDWRVSEENLRQFIYQHPELYVLRRVDEYLFKSIAFPSAGIYSVPTGRGPQRFSVQAFAVKGRKAPGVEGFEPSTLPNSNEEEVAEIARA